MRMIVSSVALTALLFIHVPPAEAATYSRGQCLTFVKHMKAHKAGKPLPNSDNEATLRFKLNFCLMEDSIKPKDVGGLLD